MSEVIEERIVSMEFDNEDFEKNINQSIKSLEELKKALNMDGIQDSLVDISKGVSNLNEVNMSKLNTTLDTVTNKFELIKALVGGTVVGKLTSKTFDAFGGLLKGAWNTVVTGGERRAQNLANAKFMLEGILEDADQVNRVMESVNDSVTGTAYSLDEAAVVAAQFATTGIEGGQKMTEALKGVAGTAAMTNSTFSDIGMIFTKVAAKGHLMGDQINQLSYRGLNATEVLAKHLGKTSEEITKMVSKGQISFKIFSEAMTEAFGEHAFKANETYAGSLSNLNAAFARIGADVAAAKLEALRDVFNAIRPLVDHLNNELGTLKQLAITSIQNMSKFAVKLLDNPLFKGIITDVVEVLTNTAFGLLSILIQMKNAFQEVFPDSNINSIRKFTRFLALLSKNLVISGKAAEIVKGAFVSIFTAFKTTITVFKVIIGLTGMFISGVVTLSTYLGGLAANLINTIRQAETFGEIVRLIGTGINSIISVVSKANSVILGFIAQLTGLEIFQNIADSVAAIPDMISSAFDSASSSIDSFFGVIKDDAMDAETKLKNFGSGVNKHLDNISKWFLNAIDSIKIFTQNIDWAKVAVISFGLLTPVAIQLAARKLTKAFGPLLSLGDDLHGVLKSTKGVLDEYKESMQGNKYLKIAASIAIIAGSMAILVKVVDDADVGKFQALALSMAALSASFALMTKFTNGKDATAVSSAMLTFAMGLAAISGSLVLLSKMDASKGIGSKLAILLGVFIYLNAMALAMTLLTKNLNINNTVFLSILPFVAAIVAIAYSLVKLNDVDLNGMWERVGALVAILGALSMVALIGKDMPIWSGVSIILMSLSLRFVIDALGGLYDTLMQNSDKLKELCNELKDVTDNFVAISTLLISAAAAIYMIGSALSKFGAAAAGIGVGVALMVGAVWLINRNKEQFEEAAISIGFLLGLIATVEIVFAYMATPEIEKSIKDSSKTMLALAGAVAIVSLIALLLSKTNPISLEMLESVSYVAALMGMIAFVMYAARRAQGAEKVLYSILATVSVITAIMVALSYVEDWSKYGLPILIIDALFVGIAVLLRRIASLKVNKVKPVLSILAGLVLTIIAVVASTIAMAKLFDTTNWWSQLITAVFVIGLISALVIAYKQLSSIRVKSKANTNLLAIMFTITACISAILVATAILASQNAGQIMTSILAVILIFTGLMMATKALNKLSKKKINKSVLVLMATIAGCVSLVLAAMTLLSTQNAGQVMTSILSITLIFFGLMTATEALYKLSKKKINESVLSIIGILTACIDSILVVTTLLATQKWSSILATFPVIIAIISELGGITYLLSTLSKKQINTSVLATLGTLATCIAVIEGVTAILARNDWSSILSTIAPIAAITWSLAGLVIAFDKLKISAGAMQGVTVALVVAAGLSAILFSLSKVAQFNSDQIYASCITSVAIVVLLGGAAIAFDKFVQVGTGAMEGAAVALVIAASLSMVLLSLSTLGNLKWQTIVYSLVMATMSIGLLLSLVVFLGQVAGKDAEVAVGIGLVTIALVALGFTLIEFAAAAAIFAAGVNLMTSHLRLIINTVQNIPTFLDALTDSVARDVPIIVTTITGAIETILITIENAVPRVQALAMDFIAGFVGPLAAGKVLTTAFSNAAAMVKSALFGIQKTQDSNSPARKTQDLAIDFNEGYTETVGDSAAQNAAQNGGEGLANAAINGVGSGDLSGVANAAMDIVNTFLGNLQSEGVKSALMSAGAKLKGWVKQGLGDISGVVSGATAALSNEGSKGITRGAKGWVASESLIRAAAATSTKSFKEASTEYKKMQANQKAAAIGLGPLFDTAKDSVEQLKEEMKDTIPTSEELANGLGGAGGAAGGAATSIDKMTNSLKSMQELQSSLQDSISNSIDIFSEFSHESDLSADKLLSNMRSQVEGVKEWSKNLQTLAGRGIERGLLQKLTELGPSGWDKVQAFVQMTDEQLQEANGLYAESLMLPQSESEKITQSFAQAGMWATDGFVNGIYTNAGYQPGMLMGQSALNGLMTALDAHSPSEATRKIGGYATEGFEDGLEPGINKVYAIGINMGKMLVKGLNSALGKAMMTSIGRSVVISFANAFTKATVVTTSVKTFCDNIKLTMEKGLLDVGYIEMAYTMMTNIITGYQTGMTEFLAEIDLQNKTLSDKMLETFTEIGEYAGEGLRLGIENKVQEVADETIKLCDKVVKAARKTFDENSPSRVFEEIGMFLGAGLANGIKGSSNQAVGATTTMADATVNSFKSAISRVQDYIQNGMNDSLTITPVMDLSNIDAGLNKMSSLVGSRKFNLSGTLENASKVAAAFGGTGSGVNSTQGNVVNNTYTFNQTNTSPKALSNAEIYRQTNNLINRYRNDIGYA